MLRLEESIWNAKGGSIGDGSKATVGQWKGAFRDLINSKKNTLNLNITIVPEQFQQTNCQIIN
jgi:hypothetical protein